MANKFVFYIAPFSFPNGGAAARRIYGNCLSLKAAGYSVAVASGQIGEFKSSYNGIDIYSYNERKHENLPRYLKHLFYFNAGAKVIELLDKLEQKPSAIILYSGYSPYLLRLRRWCTKNGVKLVFDAVEWYDPPSVFAKYFSPYYLNIEFAMRFLLPKCDSLIVISSFLKECYRGKVATSILLPPTMDVESVTPRLESKPNEYLRVCYAGSVGIKKDLLADVIAAVYQVYLMGKLIKLDIAGLTLDELNSRGFLDGIPEDISSKIVKAHGLLDHDGALALVRASDFSIVFRPKNRNVQAGFPTKFVESMCVGTPVIGNYFSDLSCYLIDGVNGLSCDEYSVESLIETLLRCFEYSDFSEMRRNARSLAENKFDFSIYAAEFYKIIP